MFNIKESKDNYFVPGPENARRLAEEQVVRKQGTLVVPVYTFREEPNGHSDEKSRRYIETK